MDIFNGCFMVEITGWRDGIRCLITKPANPISLYTDDSLMSSAFRFYVPFDAADRSPRVVPRTLDERFNDPISDWGGEGGLVGAYTTIKRNYACRMCHPVLDSFNFCFRFFFFSGRSSLYLLRYGHKTTRTSPTGERDLFTSTRFQVSEKKKKYCTW